MKSSELKRILKKKGCKLLRHGSRHDLWINPANGKSTAVPRHDAQEVNTGTCCDLLEKSYLCGINNN